MEGYKYFDLKYDGARHCWQLCFDKKIRQLDSWLLRVRSLMGNDVSSCLFEDVYDIPESDMITYEQRANFAVTSVLQGCDEWDVQRERFLNGRVGGFFDFDELSSLIANFAKFRNCVTYSAMAFELKRYISAFSFEKDGFFDLYRNDLDEVKTSLETGNNNLEQFTVGTMLRSDKHFNAFSMSFIYVKLLPIARLEKEKSELIN